MITNNDIKWQVRLKELLIDYLVIIVYLSIELMVVLVLFLGVLQDMPTLKEWQSHVISAIGSVIPIVIIFSIQDFRKGTIGKQKSSLVIYYRHKAIQYSFIRNIIKFLPWQIAHIGIIHGTYHDFNDISLLLASTGLILGVVLLCMTLFRKDKRHLGDMIAGTQVQIKQ